MANTPHTPGTGHTGQGGQTGQTVKDAAGSVLDRTKDMAKGVADQARSTASNLVDKAKDAAHTVADKARGAADSVSGGTTDMVGKVGSGLGSAATSLREHSPESGMLKTAAGKVADTLESSGRYLEQEGLSGMADDLTGMIKRNPIPSLLIALGVGFLLARATRS
jgi:uncharacterized protein YjbJ (UPF0337 family)